MSQGRNRSHEESASRSRSKSRSQSRSGGGAGGSRSRSRSQSLVSTASYETNCLILFIEKFLFSGRAARIKGWNGDSGYRIHVSPLNPRTKRQDIEKIFLKYGTINEVYRRLAFEICFQEKNLFRFGWQRIHHVSLLWTTSIETMQRKQSVQWTESMWLKRIESSWEKCSRSIDNSRVGISFARKRTVGGRRGGGGGGGDRYSRDRDSSRYRRRYSPRQSDDR